jgi:PAS domain S-box-containing protein
MSVPFSAASSKTEQQLRQRMEERHPGLPEEVLRLIEELEFHQIELEQQNGELCKARQQLEAYRDRYIDLYDFAPLGYVTLDKDGFVQEINLAGAKLLDVERDALTGYAFGDYVAKEDQETFINNVRQCAGEHSEVTFEVRLASKCGRSITTQFHSIPIDGPMDETLCKTAITDISERRMAEEALEQERNLLRTLIDNLPDYISVKDSDSRFLAANLATVRIMGAGTTDDLLGKTDADFCSTELAAEYLADEQELMRSGQPLVNKEESQPDSSGKLRTVLTTKIPLKDQRGKVIGLVAISRDITERR